MGLSSGKLYEALSEIYLIHIHIKVNSTNI